MKAVVQDRYGGADALAVTEIDTPRPGEGEVLVRVCATGADRGVLHLTTGLPYVMRFMGSGLRTPRQQVPGRDMSGVVHEVGPTVKAFHRGDPVFGIGRATFAEYAVASVETLAHKPVSLSFTEAAAMPTSGMTALQALRDHARVHFGQRVMVLGASGGVGSFAVQIAKAAGASVTAVCSASKAWLAHELGAHEVIDYERCEPTALGRQWDVIVDIGGQRDLVPLCRALTATGTLVIVSGENGGRWVGGSDRQIRAAVMSSVLRKKLVGFIACDNANDLRVLAELAEQRRLRAVVSHTFPLQEAPMALRHLSEGHAVGKVVVVVEKSDPDGESRGHGDDGRGTRGHEETPRTTDEARGQLREGPTRAMEDAPGSRH